MEPSITETNKPKDQTRGDSGSIGETSNKKREILLQPESSLAQEDGKLKWEIGQDEHYYGCVLCEKGFKLFCCEFCHATYHLCCLKFENDPKGNWKCPHCEYDDSKPLIEALNEIIAKRKADKQDASCVSSCSNRD